LNRDEIACLRDLQKQDVKIIIQPVPTAPALDVFNLLQSKGW
jgi:mannose/fructose/N-acetylgalactosamine-specific phosphotransferase system component IIB